MSDAAAAAADVTWIRAMTPADIPAGLRLCAQAGWNQTQADWERLLAWEPEGCFAVEETNGAVVATVTTTVYGPAARMAWVGMMLVDAAHRRRGLGSALLGHAIYWLENTRGVDTVGLDATPLGKTLYDGVGFSDQYSLKRYEGIAPALEMPPGITSLRPSDLPDLVGLDAAAFGADRLRIVGSLLQDTAARVLVARDPSGAGGVRGYVCVRPGARVWYIGPLVAADALAAEELLYAALAPLTGQKIAVDTPDDNAEAVRLMEQISLQPARPFIRMARGRALPPADLACCFAIAGPEVG